MDHLELGYSEIAQPCFQFHPVVTPGIAVGVCGRGPQGAEEVKTDHSLRLRLSGVPLRANDLADWTLSSPGQGGVESGQVGSGSQTQSGVQKRPAGPQMRPH